MIRDPSFIVIPVGGDEHTSRDEVVATFRDCFSAGPLGPALYVIDDPWMVLSIAKHVQGRAGAAALPPDERRTSEWL